MLNWIAFMPQPHEVLCSNEVFNLLLQFSKSKENVIINQEIHEFRI